MVRVQKINFKANTPGLLQQNFVTTSIPASSNQLPAVANADTYVSSPQATLSKQEQDLKTVKSVAYASAGATVVAVGVAVGLAIKTGKMSKAIDALKDTTPKFDENAIVEKIVNKVEEKSAGQKKTLDEQIASILKEIAEKAKHFDAWLMAVEKTEREGTAGIYTKIGEISQHFHGWCMALESMIKRPANVQMERNVRPIDGLNLLQNVTNDEKRIDFPQVLSSRLNNMSKSFIYNGSHRQKTNPLGPDSVVWSVASEAIPEKEGGVGEVVVQMANNMRNKLKIQNYVVKPLYEIPGRSKIEKIVVEEPVKIDGKVVKIKGKELLHKVEKYEYFFDLDKAKTYKMDATKIAEYEVPAYRSGKSEMQKIEVYSGIDERTGYETIMFSNHDYFGAAGIYKDSTTASVDERFALFPKAVYEFIKLKKDPNSLTRFTIFDKAAFDAVKAPDGMFINDYHASGLVPLMKVQSIVEASFGELDKNVAEEMHKICLDNIVHNADYQGSDWRHSDDVINTLHGKYAYDIHEHLNSGFQIDGLRKVLILGNDNRANLANMGAILSNFVEPVSPNYAHELATQNERSKAMQHIFKTRMEQGTMQGCGNGWDKAVNEVSVDNLPGYVNSINNDKFVIFKEKITGIKDLGSEIDTKIKALFNKGLSAKEFKTDLENLQKLNNPKLNKAIEELEAQGVTKLRSYLPYTDKDSLETILAARKHDKQMLWEYAKSMIEYNKANEKKLFNIIGLEHTDLSKIKPEELDDIPFISFGVRFVGQKGIDTACGMIEQIQKIWPTKYPGKHKPVFIMGGADGQSGEIKEIAVNAKNRLKNDGENMFYMDGFAPNNLFHAGSDLTISPSHFEPDGSGWEPINRGTPVGATRVGGQVDTVKDGVNGYLAKEGLSQFDGMMEVLDRFFADFYNKDAYNKLVRTTIDSDRSWIVENDQGKIIGGALLKRLKHLNFDLKKFEQIEMTDEEIQKL